MNNCGKFSKKHEELMADKADYHKKIAEFNKVKTPNAKHELLQLKEKIQAAVIEIRNMPYRFQIERRESIAERYGAKFVSGFQKGIAYAEYRDGSCILVNEQGDKIVDDIFLLSEIQSIKEGIAVIRKLKRDYCIKSDGTVLDIKQAKAAGKCEFSEGFLLVEKMQGGWQLFAFMDERGKMHPKKTGDWYLSADRFSCGYARVIFPEDGSIHDNNVFIDVTGKVFEKNGHRKFRQALNFSENKAAVMLLGERHWRFMNTEGEIISGDYEFQEAGYFKDGMAIVKLNGLYGYLTKDGKLIPENQADWFDNMPGEFSDGYGLVDEGRRFMDKTGEFHPDLNQPPFLDATSFFEGLALVRFSNGRSGYVNKEFNLVIQCKFGGFFKDGVAMTEESENGTGVVYIDKYGNKVF